MRQKRAQLRSGPLDGHAQKRVLPKVKCGESVILGSLDVEAEVIDRFRRIRMVEDIAQGDGGMLDHIPLLVAKGRLSAHRIVRRVAQNPAESVGGYNVYENFE